MIPGLLVLEIHRERAKGATYRELALRFNIEPRHLHPILTLPRLSEKGAKWLTRGVRPEHIERIIYRQKGEHRKVAEKVLGRKLRPGETVHHINNDPSDNRPENLMLFPTAKAHTLYHRGLLGSEPRAPAGTPLSPKV